MMKGEILKQHIFCNIVFHVDDQIIILDSNLKQLCIILNLFFFLLFYHPLNTVNLR